MKNNKKIKKVPSSLQPLAKDIYSKTNFKKLNLL